MYSGVLRMPVSKVGKLNDAGDYILLGLAVELEAELRGPRNR